MAIGKSKWQKRTKKRPPSQRVKNFGNLLLCHLALQTLQQLMEQILQGLPWTVCLVHLDDVIVHAKTLADEFENLRTVFRRLRQAGLKLNPRKCHLFQKSVRYLGHVVSESGIAVDPEKTIAVGNWPEPRNKTEVRSFLGLSTYYRRFIPHLADVARPLQQLTEKDREFSWTEECQGSFENLKKLLTMTPILAYPNLTDEFGLDADASDRIRDWCCPVTKAEWQG